MSKQVNLPGIELVKSFEGLKLEAYRCPAGVWTIGYGHTGNEVIPGLSINQQQAEQLLQDDLNHSGLGVEKLVSVGLTDNQFAALVSFTFNVGINSLACSTLLTRLNGEDYQSVPPELAKWVKATDPKTKQKITLSGLVKRRAAEGVLWLKDNSEDFSLSATEVMVQAVDVDETRSRFQVAARGGLRVRAGAGINYDVRQTLAENSLVYVIREKNDWTAVDIQGDGLIDGWVATYYLRHSG